MKLLFLSPSKQQPEIKGMRPRTRVFLENGTELEALYRLSIDGGPELIGIKFVDQTTISARVPSQVNVTLEFLNQEIVHIDEAPEPPSVELAKLRGQIGVLQALLKEADSTLSTIAPEGTDEAELLARLRQDIATAIAAKPEKDLLS